MSTDTCAFRLFSKTYLNLHEAGIIPTHYITLTQDHVVKVSALFIWK